MCLNYLCSADFTSQIGGRTLENVIVLSGLHSLSGSLKQFADEAHEI